MFAFCEKLYFHIKITTSGIVTTDDFGDNFNRAEIYAAVITNMFPSVAFVLLNRPNDFIRDFNRYPEAFETVSLVQYPR